jgi:branched-chain amino acid transport system permease protein
MNKLNELKLSIIASIWFMFLTFPIMVIRINTITNTVEWRWLNMFYVGAGSFFLSFLWRYMIRKKEQGAQEEDSVNEKTAKGLKRIINPELFKNRKVYFPACILFAVFLAAFPFIFSMYQINIIITALIYVMMGLGLNIVVGLAGLLDLGYVAFYAVGAYGYALLNFHFGFTFWMALPFCALLATLFGIVLGFPVLRLRGDYLAIVTLGFGEIIRLVLENWNKFSFGPSGISNIPKPPLFGLKLSLTQSTIFIYFVVLALCVFTIFVVSRLRSSRIGRAWIALREDEIACKAMGIDITKTKLTAFALGATWAGMAGVIFAAKTAFINPASFTFMESIIILCVVVLGGMGSIIGVVVGALILILLPEYLRAFSEYRMLLFGMILVITMIFRPGGIVANVRKTYKFKL